MEDSVILNNEDDTPIEHILKSPLNGYTHSRYHSESSNISSFYDGKIKIKKHRSKKWRNGIRSKKK